MASYSPIDSTPSSASKSRKSPLYEWPGLPAVNDTQTIYVDTERGWLEQRCPPELEMLPAKLPAVIARIIQESTLREEFLQSRHDQFVASPEPDHIVEAPAAEKVLTTEIHPEPVVKEDGPIEEWPIIHSHIPAISTDSKSSESEECNKELPAVPSRGRSFMKRLLRRISSPKEDCASCLERLPTKRLVTLPCRHKYCSACLNKMALIAMADQSSFPPRCCSQEVASNKILPTLSPEDRTFYNSKMEEYETPIADRWYCPAADCGKWISPKSLESESPLQICPHCSAVICSSCRSIAHHHQDCSQDPGLTAVLEEARRQKWQRCYNCGSVVELTIGCHQITCRCKAQFCYKCGSPWESCTCVVSEERPVDFLQLEVHGDNAERGEETDLAAVVRAIEYAEREDREERERNEQIQEERCRREEDEGTSEREHQRRLEIDERVGILGEFLSEINRLQQACLIDRQRDEGFTFLTRQKVEGERLERERQTVVQKHQRSVDARFQRLASSHVSELRLMQFEHEEEEASLIVKFPRLFKGLPNAEEREAIVLGKLRDMQEEDRVKLREDHEQAMANNRQEALIERGALESTLKSQWRAEQKQVKSALRSLVQSCVYDRFWFDQAVAKREEMLERYRHGLINRENQLGELSFVEAR